MTEVGRREAICARLNEVLQTVEAIKAVSRNETNISATSRPAANQIDGDEDIAATPPRDEKLHAGPAKTMIVMLPLIDVLVGEPSENVGSVVNALRADITRAIMSDGIAQNGGPPTAGSLLALIGPHGWIQYIGMGTKLSRSFNTDCDLSIRMAIHTLFNPNAP